MSETVSRQERRDELAEMRFDQGGKLWLPETGRDLMDKATMMAKADFMVRDIYRNNPGACAALITICAPLGINPVMASWKTYKASKNADAPISFEAQFVVSLINLSAPTRGKLRYEFKGEGHQRYCIVSATAKDGAELTYTSPTIGQITVKNSPLWKADPDQQLGYYAARSWARRHFPEMLMGVYTPDETEQWRGPDNAKDVTPSRFEERLQAARKDVHDIDQTPAEAPEDASQDFSMSEEDAERMSAEARAASDRLAEDEDRTKQDEELPL